jgi:hypothetical protein
VTCVGQKFRPWQWRNLKGDIVQSKFLEFSFRRFAEVKVISMLGAEFCWNAYLCVQVCLSVIIVLYFSHIICVLLYIVMDLSLHFSVFCNEC